MYKAALPISPKLKFSIIYAGIYIISPGITEKNILARKTVWSFKPFSHPHDEEENSQDLFLKNPPRQDIRATKSRFFTSPSTLNQEEFQLVCPREPTLPHHHPQVTQHLFGSSKGLGEWEKQNTGWGTQQIKEQINLPLTCHFTRWIDAIETDGINNLATRHLKILLRLHSSLHVSSKQQKGAVSPWQSFSREEQAVRTRWNARWTLKAIFWQFGKCLPLSIPEI